MSDLESAYIALGTDRAKVSQVIARLKQHFPDDAIEIHPASPDSSVDLIASFDVMGLFAEQRLVIVTGAHDWKAADLKPVIDWLDAPSPGVVLLMLFDKLTAKAKIRKSIPPSRIIACPGPGTPAELQSWLSGLFGQYQVAVEQPAITRLVELCCGIQPSNDRSVKELSANDHDRLRTDVERIATYAGSDPVTVAMIDELATRSSDEKVWKIGDAWASRDRTRVLQLVEQLLEQREAPIRIVGSLGRHLRAVNDAHHMMQSMSPTDAQKSLVESGTNQWAAKSIIQQAQRVRTPYVDAALSRIAQLDTELKGASVLASRIGENTKAGQRLVLERGICEIV